MGDGVLLDGTRTFVCPNCTQVAVEHGPLPPPGTGAARMHACRGLRGMLAPLVPAGMDCQVVAVEREDYIGTDIVTRDGDGRPIMAVRTERADGSNDCVVFAPCAVGKVER